jgi:hypothetical protein
LIGEEFFRPPLIGSSEAAEDLTRIPTDQIALAGIKTRLKILPVLTREPYTKVERSGEKRTCW